MSREKAERHLSEGDKVMAGKKVLTPSGFQASPECAFRLYNSALGNYEKVNDVDGQRVALSRMLSAASAWGNWEMEANCRKWLRELDAE